MSIYDSLEKINPVKNREGSQRPPVFNGVKHFFESDRGRDILVVLIVILVGIGSFELGRLSKAGNSSGIRVEYPDSGTGEASFGPANAISAVSSTSRPTFFASSKGTKYYTTSCSAGKTIKMENRVYFATGEEAEAAGYTLSSSCR